MTSTTTLAPRGARLAGLGAVLGESPALLPGLGAIAVFVAMAGSEAGFYPVSSTQHPGLGWYPAAALLLALLAAAAIAVRPRHVPRAMLAALALLGAFTAWSYLSILWAEQQGVAWDGANRTAMYLVCFALFALWRVTARGAQILVGGFGLGIAGLGLGVLLLANAGDPAGYFNDARFVEPAGYINANAAIWTLGLWPCLYLASLRQANPLLRGLALGGAGLLTCLALMGQSRGWGLAVPLAALFFIVVTPLRARALTTVGLVGLGTFVARGPILAVHDAYEPDRFDGLVAAATGRIVLLAGVLAAVGLAAAIADRSLNLGEAVSRTAHRAALAAVVVVLLGATGAVTVTTGNPVEQVSNSWESFQSNQASPFKGSSRFTSTGSNRYDFWTVAWGRFTDRPLTGIGSQNFQLDYLQQGKSVEQPRYPHSLQLGVLSQTGLIGALLLTAALIAAALPALTTLRRGPPGAAGVAATALAIFVYWLLHASVDWFWEFPGLTAPAFAMLGLAAAVRGRPPGPSAGSARRARGLPSVPRTVPLVAVTLAGTALTLSFALPWLAEREIARASADWPASPSAAFKRLDRASTLNPLSPRAHLAAAAIAVKVEDQARASLELEKVLQIEPRTPFALAELAALASERGDAARSEELLRMANAHAPRDEVVMNALEQVRSGGQIDLGALNARYLERVRKLVGGN